MWCDNCLLLLPLRAGAIAWGVVIALYSIIGSIFLFKYGMFIYFIYPEWQIYGGIGMAVAATSIVNIIALSNRSYLFVRVCKFLWPFVIIISAIRAILMIWELNRGQSNLAWECANGGEQFGLTPLELEANPPTIPLGLCTTAFSSIFTAFIVSLLVDLVFQMYMFFLNWRYCKRLEHYSHMKGPMNGGYYNPY